MPPHGEHHRHHDEHRGRRTYHGGLSGHGGKWGGEAARGHERMERGALRFVLLDMLRTGPQHGYEMIKSLEERTHGRYSPSPGAIYPTLQYLADLGLIRATQDADRRVYELTETGRAELEAQREWLDAFWTRLSAHAPSASIQHEVGFLQEEMEDLSRTIWSGLREAIRRSDQESIRRVRRAVEQCQEEVRRLIVGGPSATETPEGAV